MLNELMYQQTYVIVIGDGRSKRVEFLRRGFPVELREVLFI